ncbi:membrane-associated protein, putative [Bodo saltans]|uniref:Membrane-associated protein, putative n=1 Tax=Bodo saltans TaxID=75058 RepID=A0A0S4IYP0_BODSA|nr:membrane-associated protein, putative [Bodo saltans]|eukprot:CUG57853.1 membrane-associated protein, putative [Bodo saltans]
MSHHILLMLSVAVALTFAFAVGTSSAAAPLVINVTIPYEFDAMRCAGGSDANSINLLIAVQWGRLVAISPTTGATVWNWTIAEKYNETEGVALGPVVQHVVVLLAGSTRHGIDITTGALLWTFDGDYIGIYDSISQLDDAGYLWFLKYSKGWLAALNLVTGTIVKNVTLPAHCNRSDTFVAVHYPYALIDDTLFHDSNDKIRTECMVDMRLSAAAPVAWSSTYNKTLIEFYLKRSTISGNCTDASADPSTCLIIRQGQDLDTQHGYYVRFARTYIASTGIISALYLRTPAGAEGCYIDGYTEFSHPVDIVASTSGVGADAAYPAGAVAMRCYTSDQSKQRVLTNLVNVSNFTQQWGRYTTIPRGFDGDRVLLSPTVTWAVVNQGNWVSARSVSINAYVTATGGRPGTMKEANWPLWFPDYMLERMNEKTSCNAGNYFVMVARNESLMDPYIKTLVFVTV